MGGDRSSDKCDEEEDRDEYPSCQRELVLLEPQPDARPVAARLDSRPAIVLLSMLSAAMKSSANVVPTP